MTPQRTLVIRLAAPLATVALLLAACGSSGTGEDPATSLATMEAGTMAPSPMESEPMESETMESETMESETMESETMESEAAAAAGGYITLAEYEGSKDMYADSDVVLFFAADWCPTCQEATGNLEADPAAIPSDLAIVRVDYDTADELKQRYGITVQHTFVQVDAEGNELAKWNGSVTAEQIAEQTA
jgi:thiol-disulfide isomerase/thioredoxin